MEVIVSISFGDDLGAYEEEEKENYDELETYEDVVVPEEDESSFADEVAATTLDDKIVPEGEFSEYAPDAYYPEYVSDSYAEPEYVEPTYPDQPVFSQQYVYIEQPVAKPAVVEQAARPEQPVVKPAIVEQFAQPEQPIAEPVVAERVAQPEREVVEPTFVAQPAEPIAETAVAKIEHNNNEPARVEVRNEQPVHVDNPGYDYSYFNYNDTSVHETNNNETHNYEIHNHYDVTYQLPQQEAAPAPAPVQEAAPAPVQEVAPAPAPVVEVVQPVKEDRTPAIEEIMTATTPFIPQTREEAERYLSVLLIIVDTAMADPDTTDADLEEIAVLIETARTESFREPEDQAILEECLKKLVRRWKR